MVFEWAKFLSDQKLTNELIGYACRKCVDDPNLDPYKLTIAKFLSYVKPEEQDPKALALEAWDKVVSYVSRGKARLGIDPEWGQRTVSATNSIGGLQTIGDADTTKLSFLRNSFIKAYVEYAGIYKNREKQMLLESGGHPQLNAAMAELNAATKME